MALLRPFWVSPRQVIVLPVAAPFKEYATEVASKLWDAGIYAEADMTDSTLNKRIRNAEIAQVRSFAAAHVAPADPACFV